MNKRGSELGRILKWLGPFMIVLIIVSTFVMSWANQKEMYSKIDDTGGMNLVKAFTGNEEGSFAWLDYIFGKVPGFLISFTENGSGSVGAGIILIAIWFLLFFTFADIMRMFSLFSSQVSILIGFLITIIAINMGLVKVVIVYGLATVALLGINSILAGVLYLFLIFILFLFGSTKLRQEIRFFRARERASRLKAKEMEAAAATNAQAVYTRMVAEDAEDTSTHD
jgi:hypothetical protein